MRACHLVASASPPPQGPLAAAVLGGVSATTASRWFRGLDLPPWYPPPQTFGIVWSALYAGTAWAGGEVLARSAGSRAFGRAYAVNLVLNAAWTPLFFRAHRPWLAAAESAVLTASTVDLVRRAAPVSGRRPPSWLPYAALDGVRDRAVGGDRAPQPPVARAEVSRAPA